MPDTTFIGVALAASGGIIQSFGFTAQKRGHNAANKLNETLSKDEQKSVLTQWIWWLGIATYTVGGTLNSIALNYAAQSIIAPLGAINLATIAVLSHFILKEPLTRKDVLAILIIIIGLVLVVLFGPTTDTSTITLNALRDNYSKIPYIIIVLFFSILTIIVFIIVKFYEKKNFQNENNNEITSGSKVLLFGYVWIGCFFASNNVLFIKSVVTILLSTNLSDAFTDYLTYIIVILWVACLLLMEYHRQLALSHFGALYVVPTFAVLSIIMTAIIGMIYFEEFKQFTLLSASMFTLGILITLSGVIVLSYDIGKILTELYDDAIQVAYKNYEEVSVKYTTTVVYGGFISEYFEQWFYRHRAICDNTLRSDKIPENMKQLESGTNE